MSEAVAAQTYTGYGGENNQEVIVSIKAMDATKLLDPAAVSAAVDKVKDTVNESMKSTGRHLEGLTSDSEKALVAKGANMSDTLTKTADYIFEIPAQVEEALESLKTAAFDARNALQEEINKQVKSQVQSTSGVNYVDP